MKNTIEKNKKNILKIFIITIIIILAILAIYFMNNTKILNRILGIEAKQEQEQQAEIPFFKYQIYDNQNNNELKVLLTTTSKENGIEYIQTPDGNIIYGNGKNQITIDHVCKLATDETFKIKEVNKDEVQEVLNIPESGNEEAPFTIVNAEQLQNILVNPYLKRDSVYGVKECYRLEADIDLRDIEWKPIGEVSETGQVIDSFAGKLEGNSHIIKNLNINSENSYQGLFSYVSGELKNINLENFVINGKDYVGALSGCNVGKIENCSIKETEITATGNYIGGLIGYSTGIINKNIVLATVNGNDNVGGLIGSSTNTCNDNNVQVIVSGNNSVGGLIGSSSNTVTNNNVQGTVNGNTYVGGLLGSSSNVVSQNNVNNAEITGKNYTGGLIGYASNVTKENTVEVKVIGETNTGGLLGGTSSNIEGNTVNMQVKAERENTGGLLGSIDIRSGQVTMNLNKVKGTIEGQSNVGGLVGYQLAFGNNRRVYIYLFNSYVTANILASGDNIGGLVGYSYSGSTGGYSGGYCYIQNSYSVGDINTSGNNCGGIVGYSYTWSTGVNNPGYGYTNIDNTFSIGKIEAQNNVGGLVGTVFRWGHMGSPDIYFGNSYVLGKRTGETNVDSVLGYIEMNSGRGSFNISNILWEPEGSGIEASDYGIKTNLSSMFNREQFTSFDFNSVWEIEEGNTLPYLKNLDKPDIVNRENIEAMLNS